MLLQVRSTEATNLSPLWSSKPTLDTTTSIVVAANYESVCSEINLKNLPHNWSCQSLGCYAQAATFSKVHNLGGCTRTNHWELRGDEIEPEDTCTHTEHQGAQTCKRPERIYPTRANRNPKPRHNHIHPVNPIIPPNPIRHWDPAFLDLFLHFNHSQSSVWCRGPRRKAHWYTH